MGFKDRNVGFGGEKLFRKEITTRILLDMVLGKAPIYIKNFMKMD